ncbi:MAG: DUF4178 domain-containing protein [Thermoanaerobaculia bacterium]|nr:DUF4178 domain-containing protein [Thermoanaerobaculia bacterium]
MSGAPGNVRSQSISCPSCGAPKEMRHPGIVMFTCEHCGSPVYWNEEAVRAGGRRAVLDEGFTRLYRGATGTYRRKRFRVLGRVRYLHGRDGVARGFWDEWFLRTSDGRDVWLTEDDHELSLQTRSEVDDAMAFDRYRVGSRVLHRDTEFVVEEIGVAECFGMEGELPDVWEVGETYPFVDLASPDGRYTLGFEFDEGENEPPTAFLGRWLEQSDLRLDDEGVDW